MASSTIKNPWGDIKKLTQSIAPIEDGSTYSKAYVKGEMFYRGGILQKLVADNVNSGATISNWHYTITDDIAKQLTNFDHTVDTLATATVSDTSKTLAHSIKDYMFLILMVNANNHIAVVTIPTSKIEWGHVTDNYEVTLTVPRAVGKTAKDNFYSDLCVYYGVTITSETSVNIESTYCNDNFIGTLSILGVK